VTVRVATRGSPLARWQAEHVASLLGEDAELVVVETTGDRQTDVPIWQLGERGVFVKEVQAAVLDGRADVAVHSAKDLQSSATPGLVLAAVPRREDPRDAMVGCRLDDLPTGAEVATGSVRRRAQLAAYRPDLTFANLRGNMATRLAKAEEHAAVVVAHAALIRLGEAHRADDILDPTVMLPQISQGALAVECRDGDDATFERVTAIEHGPSRLAVDAERAYLAELGGGCDLPVGALAIAEGAGRVTLTALLASLDGRIVLRHTATERDPVVLGRAVARHILDQAGGAALLETLQVQS
jgi:hydroxymethylbilane synthase